MKVKIKFFGMPELLPDWEDKKEVQVDFAGNTVKDLLHHLSTEIGSKQREPLLNDKGEISPMLFLSINGNFIRYSDRPDANLRDDDFVELFFFSGG